MQEEDDGYTPPHSIQIGAMLYILDKRHQTNLPWIISSYVRLKYDGSYWVGLRHGDAMRKALEVANVPTPITLLEDGFLTSTGAFIDRKIAYILARSNGQFKRKELWIKAHPDDPIYQSYNGDELYSEDIW